MLIRPSSRHAYGRRRTVRRRAARRLPTAASLAVGLATILSLLSVGVAPTPATARDWVMKASSQVDGRVVGLGTGAMDIGRPLASDQAEIPADQAVETRLRLGGKATWAWRSSFLRAVSLAVQGDVFGGPQWQTPASDLMRYDPWAQRSTDPWQQSRLRRAFFTVDTNLGRIAAGRTLSTWGLGLLSQAGDAEPYQFGVKREGSIVDRVQLAFAPLLSVKGGRPSGVPLFISFAADRVVFDDLADLKDGDRGTNLIAAVLYRGAHMQGGFYGVIRRQANTTGGGDLQINANAYDVFFRWSDTISGWKVVAATEWLMLKGDTTYFRTPSNPELMKINQFGGAARVTASRDHLGLRLESGVASGDDRPFDDTVSNLKFSREYRVGLVMFHEGLRRTTATLAANLNDPRYTGQAPAGFERAASAGSVSGAIYVMPTVRYQLFGKRLTLLAGALWAQAPAPLVDAYQSGLRGGDAIGPRGGAASTDLGLELDAAVAWRQPIGDHFAVNLRGDVGRWSPGAAFDDEAGSAARAVTAWMGRLELQGRW